jgi:hypothetical protein
MVLSRFHTEAISSEEMLTFGKLLWEQKPTIIIFNYDTFMEEVLKMASGIQETVKFPKEINRLQMREINELSDEELSYHFNNWDFNLSYGVKFDEAELDLPGTPIPVSSKRFYANPRNQLYTWYILKLHGSLNWFQYLPVSIYPEFVKKELGGAQKPREGTILTGSQFWTDEVTFPARGEWLIDPLLYLQLFLRNNIWMMLEIENFYFQFVKRLKKHFLNARN